MQQLGKSTLRTVKNYTKGYSDCQTKVRDATSNDPWGPSGGQMNELAQLTYNQQDFVEIMEMLDKRLNDKGKNWRHVFKALTVLDYCLHGGSENVVLYFKENLYIIKTLKEFQYIDEYGKDQGANVRQKAKDITALLQDEARLKDARKSRAHMRDRMTGTPSRDDRYSPPPRSRSTPAVSSSGMSKEERDLQRAIEESKRSQDDDETRARRQRKDDEQLAEAMRLSREEDERARREAELKNQNALFDDGFQSDGPNAYQNQLVDLNFGQPQQQLQPQYTSFNPYAQYQQDAAQLQAQQQYEYQQRMEEQARFAQMQQQQAYMQQQAYLAQQQPLVPQQTAIGSNNPFAAFGNTPEPATTPEPPRQQVQPAIPQQDFFRSSSQPIMPTQAAKSIRAATRNDGQHDKLNNLLAMGQGIDTFGNEGNMRLGQWANKSVPAATLTQTRTGPASSNANAAFASSFGPQPTGNGNPFGQSNGSSAYNGNSNAFSGFDNSFGQPAQAQQQPKQNPFFDL
ncbi:uncharacterized protein L969DRAFT_22299 [Mixia osmundae IAM 14324]|uniref:ENTH domain-containing protein n=1 Tax=Mixia osmundae (strain CBS 9802 / IAM 14324 / JCM 22182 / KY 12970) TaxID=764103 RepID=G7DYV0_MIXOS|nr:uncharacterized protein L969DRAFT_22299 [Mixia osmundae IAM 14324]KEI41656.1 hypothetical protein L969DRAFT_22299 [Mixia osmundae IAM 14324]GAA95760.1 hypothetical protein E5Q_02417 [Mixia osmundae IAM 14324]